MKLRADKCHVLMSGHEYELHWTQVGKDMVCEEKKVKLSGTTIDNELKLDSHI